MPIRGASSQPMLGVDLDQNDNNSNSNSRNNEPLHESFSFRRTISSTFSSLVTPSSPTTATASSTSPRSSRRQLLRTKSSLRQSLRRLDSSHRLSITCSGSDLSQLYLSSPEQDAYQLLSSQSQSSSSNIIDFDDVGGGAIHRSSSRSNNSSSSWLQDNVDLYGRRRSFRRMNSYARFLDMDVMMEIDESSDGGDEDNEDTKMLLIEETTDRLSDHEQLLKPKRKRMTCSFCVQKMKSPAIVVPTMMIIDLILGVSLSLYDSNLLRNVPGFNFPLCYALTQKLTNACASLVLICLSRKWEMDERRARQVTKRRGFASVVDDTPSLLELPSIAAFRRHMIPLSAVALVQTVSAAFANQALQIIPLPLFKVCLMCGPIFVALCSILAEGQMYSKGRMLALSLIGMGAFRAVYAEAEDADNPRYIMEGAGYALGASAFSGIGLVLSSVLMHRGGDSQEEEEEPGEKEFLLPDEDHNLQKKVEVSTIEEVELNPLSLLFYLSCKQVLMLSAYLCPWNIIFGGENEAVEEMQGPSEFVAFTIYCVENPQTAIFYLMTGSMMSLCLAVLTFVLVNRTSPVATSLLGNCRSILTVAISSIVFGNGGGGGGLFGSAVFGYTLTLAGGVAYAFAALRNNAPSPK